MALAKEQQRLHKKIIIARVLICLKNSWNRMLNCYVLLLLRRLKMYYVLNKLEKRLKLVRLIFNVNVKTRITRTT